MKDDEATTGFSPLFPDEARNFMAEHEEGSYAILDVRQPFEYERGHLPGATLIPLPTLADSLPRLDPGKPALVYCAAGGRSRMAAQFLAHQGFSRVFNLVGGIQAWEGRPAEGPSEFHLRFVRGDESPEEMLALAYQMEKGLQRFHQRMRDRTTDPELVELLGHLVRAEGAHLQRLVELGFRVQHEAQSPEAMVMEGGIDGEEFLARNERFLQTLAGVIDVAMMIETQALDLYLRMAQESRRPETRENLFHIAEEEKVHLAALGRWLENHLAGTTRSAGGGGEGSPSF
ncbi:MAG TPA: rhodanese-like domain-containing protein [Syntrophobacteria bacterium]|nr:rhodanese-like domain-containing protein [Syntrophobacteria bacterium]